MAKATNFDVIGASIPSDRTAGNVVAKGVHYEPALKAHLGHRRGADPLPLGGIPTHPKAREFYDSIVGKKFGHWTVFGYAAEQPRDPSKGASWVVRCSCGRYEHRKWKALKRARETGNKCLECLHLDMVRARYRKHGSKPFDQFMTDKQREDFK